MRHFTLCSTSISVYFFMPCLYAKPLVGSWEPGGEWEHELALCSPVLEAHHCKTVQLMTIHLGCTCPHASSIIEKLCVSHTICYVTTLCKICKSATVRPRPKTWHRIGATLSPPGYCARRWLEPLAGEGKGTDRSLSDVCILHNSLED